MFIYDNNLPNTENVIDVLQSYVNDGFVTVINYQDQEKYPMGKALVSAFTDCWESNKNEYDWILFLDNDEFLMLQQDSNIKEYLNRKCFENVDIIRVNWLCYDDNNLLYYEDKPLKERFTHPCNGDPFKFNENRHIKSIIHNTAKNKEINFNKGAAHSPRIKNTNLIVVNNYGKLNDKEHLYTQKINYDLAYYAHYRMKTIDEYVNNKIKKLTTQGYYNIDFSLYLFCIYNVYTKEKEKFFIEHYEQYMKNVVYTVITGDYDVLCDPTYITPGWDYICFTNNMKLKSNVWKIIQIDENNFNSEYREELYYWWVNRNQYLNRFYKINIPHIIREKYNFSIYIDGNITIVGDLNEFKAKYINQPGLYKTFIWALKHANRNCLYEEINACKIQHKDSDDNLNKLLNFYNKHDVPHNLGLSQNCVLCRYHNNKSCTTLDQKIWKYITNFTVRDQCIMYYTLYKSNLIDNIKLLFTRNNKEYFVNTNKHNK